MSDLPAREPETTTVRVTALRSQVPPHVTVIGVGPVRLSWRVEPATPASEQQAYEIETAGSGAFEALSATSGVVEGARA